ncbi:MAG: TonB-dependent receptor [Desulfobacterales bacterium]|nr:TonB-dependent receptor [Desulfobacterales bacterium]
MELACANRDNPACCPHSMQSSPFLEQVVTRSFEAGLRGHHGEVLRWQFAAYQAVNRDDILFVAAGASRGYFQNFGRTRRQGLEASMAGTWQSIEWSLGYALVDATYQSQAIIVSPNNSNRGSAPVPRPDEILVSSDDRIPNVPRHQLKLATRWQAYPRLALDTVRQCFFRPVPARQREQPSPAKGVRRRNLPRFGPRRGLCRRQPCRELAFRPRLGTRRHLENLFDKAYASAGQLGESVFPGGAFEADPEQWRKDSFFTPGAPRAFWLGIRFAGMGRARNVSIG